MDTPSEYDPYEMMTELFIMEAAELQADQILVVSREGHSNLYFVSGNRVRRRVSLSSDISSDLALHMAHKSQPAEQPANTVRIKVVDSEISNRETVSTRKPAPDVNCTMPMAPFTLVS